MAEFRRRIGLQVQNIGTGDLEARGILSATDKLAQFAERREQDLLRQRAKEGAQAGVEAGVEGAEAGDVPETREGKLDWLFGQSAFNEAYNTAAQDAYLESTGSRIKQDIGALQVKHSSDVDAFNESVQQYRETMIKNAGQFAPVVGELVERTAGNAAVKVLANQREEGLKLIAAQYAATAVDYREAALDAVRAGESTFEAVKDYAAIQRKRLQTGAISPEDYDVSMRDFKNEMIEQSVYSGLDEAYDNGFADSYIELKMDQGLPGYEGDPEKVYAEMITRMKRRVALDEADEISETRRLAEIHRAGEQELMEASATGALTPEMVAAKARKNEITSAAYLKWSEIAQRGPVLVSDGQEILSMEMDLLQYTEADIYTSQLLTNEDKQALIARRREMTEGWMSEQWAREAVRRIKNEIGLPDGDTVDADENLVKMAHSALTSWYDEVENLEPKDRRARGLELAKEATVEYRIENLNDQIQSLQNRIDAADELIEKGEAGNRVKQMRDRRAQEIEKLRGELEGLTGG